MLAFTLSLLYFAITQAEALHAMEQLFYVSHATAESNSLARDVFFGLLANFRLWVYTKPEMQFRCLSVLESIVANVPTIARLRRGVQKLLDQLRRVYWITHPESTIAAAPKLYHKALKDEIIGHYTVSILLALLPPHFLSPPSVHFHSVRTSLSFFQRHI